MTERGEFFECFTVYEEIDLILTHPLHVTAQPQQVRKYLAKQLCHGALK